MPRQSSFIEMAIAAAEILWTFAISDDQEISRYDSTPYRSAETVFQTTYRLAWPDDSDYVVTRVRDLLAELGPYDGYYGQPGSGIVSYRYGACEEERAATIQLPV